MRPIDAMSEEILLYLVDRPMRTGKSQIARRFNALTGVSYVSTDDLFAMLGVAAPSLKIGWDSGNTWPENRRKLAPFVAGLARDRVRDASPLLIEGELLPDMVGSLLRESGGKARACFVGNSAMELEDKVRILQDWERFPRRLAFG